MQRLPLMRGRLEYPGRNGPTDKAIRGSHQKAISDWNKTKTVKTNFKINAIVLWLVNNNLELTCKEDYGMVESAPPFSLGNNNNLAWHNFAQLRMPRAWPNLSQELDHPDYRVSIDMKCNFVMIPFVWSNQVHKTLLQIWVCSLFYLLHLLYQYHQLFIDQSNTQTVVFRPYTPKPSEIWRVLGFVALFFQYTLLCLLINTTCFTFYTHLLY